MKKIEFVSAVDILREVKEWRETLRNTFTSESIVTLREDSAQTHNMIAGDSMFQPILEYIVALQAAQNAVNFTLHGVGADDQLRDGRAFVGTFLELISLGYIIGKKSESVDVSTVTQ